jgi:lysine biosynthesis protein LysW
MQNARCPVCSSDVIIEDEAFENDLVTCAICENELEITSLHPLQLTPLKEEEDGAI